MCKAFAIQSSRCFRLRFMESGDSPKTRPGKVLNFIRKRNGAQKIENVCGAWVDYRSPLHFYARSQNCEKRLLASLRLSVRPHGTTRLPLDGFLLNWIYEHFSKIWRKFKFEWTLTEYRLLYMKTYVHLWYLAEFLKCEMFQTKVVEQLETHILCSITFFLRIVPFFRWYGKMW